MGHTVLVIDDQWSMQELARIVLRTAGYRVLLAGDVITGLSLARTEHPDLTILDVQLTDSAGEEFLTSMRQDPKTAEIPVLLIAVRTEESTLPLVEDDQRCLQKPFRPPELLRKVDGLLRREQLRMAV